MNFIKYIFCDWVANKKNPKARIILILFRSAVLVRKSPKILFLVFFPYLIFYRFFVEWILGVEIPWNLRVGPGFRLFHGQSLVINDKAIIGRNVTLRHCTTIGHKVSVTGVKSNAPILGDNVDVGSNVVLLGDITIGSNVIVGAGSVVLKSFPDNCVIAGNPARIIRLNILD